MLETVSYLDERDQNVDKQILYLKVMGLMCVNGSGLESISDSNESSNIDSGGGVNGKAKYHY